MIPLAPLDNAKSLNFSTGSLQLAMALEALSFISASALAPEVWGRRLLIFWPLTESKVFQGLTIVMRAFDSIDFVRKGPSIDFLQSVPKILEYIWVSAD